MPNQQKVVCARAARQEFSEAYRGGIQTYRSARRYAGICGPAFASKLPDGIYHLPFQHLHDAGVARMAWEGAVTRSNQDARFLQDLPFRVMARKRPLQESELAIGEYDSATAECSNNAVVIHDGRVHRDGRTLYMVHSRFCLERVFTEVEGNSAVYEEAAKPLLEKAQAGGRSTLLLFGQTGTGKTYTASGVLHQLAEDLFPSNGVRLYCYEMAGARGGKDGFFDLLNERSPVKCLTGEDGQVHVRGAKAADCRTADEFREAVRKALAWRTSEVTERNEASSRSHAILEIHMGIPKESRVTCALNETSAAWGEESEGVDGEEAVCTKEDSGLAAGVLRIVDLAGSERNFETQQHTRQMAERGGVINYSLLMLKECARIMHKNRKILENGRPGQVAHVPFRRSRLTHLLRSCFTDEAHRTVVITTLSPAPTDIEHSLNSLQHVGMMRAGAHVLLAGVSKAGTVASNACSSADGFGQVEGRGHALHSKLQDVPGQLRLHAFEMITDVGGTIKKKYEASTTKQETFIDARWHREMNVAVDEDLWVLREADAEVVEVLSAWKQERWDARRASDVSRWDASTVHSFLQSLELPGEVRLPSTMTGAQLLRLGRRGVLSLCAGDTATAEATCDALQAALASERASCAAMTESQRTGNAKLTGLGLRKAPAPKTDASLVGGS